MGARARLVRIRGATVSRIVRQFAAFLKAEEVPRWFGLSIVVIYLIGLATVANVGILHARRSAQEATQSGARVAMEILADQAGSLISAHGTISAEVKLPLRREFMRVANALPLESLSLVENGRVRVALDAALEDTPVIHPTDPMGSHEDELGFTAPGLSSWNGRRLRIPIIPRPDITRPSLPDAPTVEREHAGAPETPPPAAATNGEAPASPADTSQEALTAQRYLEAVLPEAGSIGSFTTEAGVLSIVLVVLGALLVTYRCVRQHLRGVSQIAERLSTNRERIREELASLHIADSVALDQVTEAWNELVDLAQSLAEQVCKDEANAELTRVLQNKPGSALAEALNVLSDAIIHIAEEGRLDYANSSACRLMGWAPEDVTGARLPDTASAGLPRRVLEVIRQSQQPDGSFLPLNEIVEGLADSDAGSFRLWVIPIRRQHNEGGCVVVIRDVSQQLRADKSREEFITQVTHELRTPLTNIRAYAETLSSGMFDDPQVVTECYNVITKETRRLSRLIEDILSVSQLEVGSIELTLDNVDLKTLLTESVRDVRGLAEEKQIDLQLVLPAKLEPVRADRDKLAVVVNNLLGNSIKYTPQDGTILVGCQVGKNEVMITVKDNGIGIAPGDHGRIFEKFQRGSSPEARMETGTGIGLYTAREITRRHGGDIEVISEIGQGSTFMVRLPQRAGRASSLSTTAEDTKS